MTEQTYLQKLRCVQLELLEEFIRVCQQNNLTYFLAFGTLLGAVRHKVYIPWDDDIDVYMPREDFQRFCSLSSKSDGKYFLRNSKTDPQYWLKFAKLEKKGTLFLESLYEGTDISMGIFIDVFPLDSADGNTWRTRFKLWLALKLEVMLRQKRGIYRLGGIRGFLPRLFSFRFLHRLQDWVTRGKGDYFIHYGAARITRLLMPKAECLPVEMLPFEGRECCVPRDSKAILARFFGDDFMELPPPEKRVTHKPLKIDFDER